MMYGWWHYGSGEPWFGMFFGPLMMIGVVVVTVLIIVWMMRAPGGGGQSDRQGRSPLDVLKDRFARGEIDVSEYEVRRQHLSR